MTTVVNLHTSRGVQLAPVIVTLYDYTPIYALLKTAYGLLHAGDVIATFHDVDIDGNVFMHTISYLELTEEN